MVVPGVKRVTDVGWYESAKILYNIYLTLSRPNGNNIWIINPLSNPINRNPRVLVVPSRVFNRVPLLSSRGPLRRRQFPPARPLVPRRATNR